MTLRRIVLIQHADSSNLKEVLVQLVKRWKGLIRVAVADRNHKEKGVTDTSKCLIQ